MGTTAQKLTYLNTTKTKIKDAINKAGNYLDSSDTFRSYANTISQMIVDTINDPQTTWDKFPKKTGTGASVTLNGVYTAPIGIKPNGNTSQDTTTGNNLIDTNGGTTLTDNNVTFTPTYNSNGGLESINVNGTATANATYIFPNYVTLKAGTYYISKGSVNYVRMLIVDSNGTSYITTGTTQDEESFTLSEDKSVRLYLRVYSGTAINNVILYPMVATTSEATYEPYTYGASPNPNYPQPIHVVSGDNEISICGKNLLEIPNGTYTSTGNEITAIVEDGVITLNGTATATRFVDFGLFFKLPKGTYSIKANPPIIGDSGGAVRLATTSSAVSGASINFSSTGYNTFTTTEDLEVGLQIRTASGVSYNNFVIKPQLEVGNQASTFEPYIGNTYPISLGNIELCKIDTYQDYIYKENDKWYLYKEIGKIVLDGTENWNKTAVFYVNNVVVPNAINNSKCFSTYFKYYLDAGINNSIYIAGSGKNIWIKSDAFATASDLQTWLSTHNTIVYYVLATPTTTLITDSTLIEQLEALKSATSYENQTNISQENNDLPFILDVKALEKE